MTPLASHRRLGPAGHVGRFFVDNPLSPLLVVASLALGALALALTPREEEPQIVVPMVDLFLAMPGSEVAEVERRLTQPIERRLAEIPGVEYVYSTSMPGRALVTARFRVGDDPERSLVKVHDQLAAGLDRMPSGAPPPLVRSRSIDDVPVLALTLSSTRHGGFALRRLAVELAHELATLPDVADVRVIGGERRQVRVELDSGRLASAALDAASVIDTLTQANAAAGTGRYTLDDREILVETGGFLRDAAEVASLVVGVAGGRPVHLRDVARVVDGGEEPKHYVFFVPGAGGSDPSVAPMPAVTIALAKREGADAHRVVERARSVVRATSTDLLPEGVRVTVTRDYGATAKEEADELLRHLALAIVSVSVLIGFALGWRGALVVFVSVPVSFALTLFVYYIFGYTLNRVTLFALIFVTGIVVDDSIIVVENVVRHFAAGGRSALEAAVAAIDEVGNPTILATLTVIASVLPMAFVRGLMGPYMLPMPVGATLAMSFSLMIALIAAPWFAYRLLRSPRASDPVTSDGSGRDAEPRGLAHRAYSRLLRPMMLRPVRAWLFLGLVALLLLASLALVPLGQVQLKMLPFDNKSELMVALDLPEGTSLERTARIAEAMAEALTSEPAVRDLQLYVGTAAPITFNGLVRHDDLRAGANVADIQVNLLPKHDRAMQSHALAGRLRRVLAPLADRFGVALKVVEVPPGPPVLSTLVAEVYGPSERARIAAAEAIRDIFATTDGVVDVDWLVEAPQAKEIFRIDHARASLTGIPAARIARVLAVATGGTDVGLIHAPDEREAVPIRVELPRAERSSPESLAGLRIATPGSRAVPLSELVRVEESVRTPSRHRKNLRPVVYVVGEVSGAAGSPAYAILAMRSAVGAVATPDGKHLSQHFRGPPADERRYAVVWDGEWQITYEVFRDLGAAFGAALLLIYLLIVGWFRSFTVPLVMMIAIPLALIGVLPGHALADAYFTATSMIGFIALAGIMVRNSVLLIDFVDLELARGRALGEAVIEAGATRLRPILLTAGTVVVGAVVILFDPIFQGLAIALISGAIASTALTLLVVPLVYYMTSRRHYPRPLPAAWTTED